MDWALVVILQIMFQPCLSVLFTVEAERTTYTSEFEGDVVMGCRFQPKLSSPHDSLKVTWHWITSELSREVYRMDNSVEHTTSQDPDYQGRVRLLKEELNEGWAKIQVSRLRISDSGTYQCVVQTGEGFDYKTIKLSVVAPYKTVTKNILKVGEGNEVLLTCKSKGYPKSDVIWQDGHQSPVNSNSAAVETMDKLFEVTSEIRVRSSDKNNYTCTFTNDGLSATFHTPDDIFVPVNNDGLIVGLSIMIVIMLVTAVILVYLRRKGCNTPNARLSFVNGRNRTAAASDCSQVNKENEEERIIINEAGCKEENLVAGVKALYSNVSFSVGAKPRLDAFVVEELSQRLQNNEGNPVNLQALVPKPGETLFLEGPPGSGKTTAAHILVSSWTEGSTRSLDVSTLNLKLLLYVDCSRVKGDLLQEKMTQLSLTETISAEDELRTLLTGSSVTLLLLDGYREGNPSFDESLKKFLSERQGCRVLVTACPGDCPLLRDTVGTGGVLELQRQTVKY